MSAKFYEIECLCASLVLLFGYARYDVIDNAAYLLTKYSWTFLLTEDSIQICTHEQIVR